jgi:hypothetical protein
MKQLHKVPSKIRLRGTRVNRPDSAHYRRHLPVNFRSKFTLVMFGRCDDFQWNSCYVRFRDSSVPEWHYSANAPAWEPDGKCTEHGDLSAINRSKQKCPARTEESYLSEQEQYPRYYSMLLGLFAAVATALAAVGIYRSESAWPWAPGRATCSD